MVKQNPVQMMTDHQQEATKAKSSKGGKQTTYCSACGEPDHNISKCKEKHGSNITNR